MRCFVMLLGLVFAVGLLQAAFPENVAELNNHIERSWGRKEVRAELTAAPERHAKYTREYLGWGVFALMAR